MLMFLTLILLTILILMKIHKKKLNVLLTMETLMIFLIVENSSIKNLDSFNMYLMLLLSIFMVLDSIFGLSLLIKSSRNNSNTSYLNKI